MKAETVNPFIAATINVFETMAGITVKKGDLYIKQDKKVSYDISGVIGIAGDVKGFIVLSFPEKLALKIVSGFLCEEKTEMNDDVVDAVGEFINMIAGSSKRIFADQGLKYNIGIPSVIIGHNHMISRPSNIVCIGVKFHVDDMDFTLEVALKDNPQG